jgi:hypothetical protein
MLTETQPAGLTVEEATALRQQATELLNRLMVDCEQSKKRIAESGKRDPMKFITGRTALENAIASTREMIDNMDRMLADMNAELHGLSSAHANGHARGAFRHHAANGKDLHLVDLP